MSESLFTSESVTEGHPDKLCDQVSDGILDALLRGDKGSRVACETLTKTGFVMVAGEVTSTAQIDIPKIVRGVVKEIGYSTHMGLTGSPGASCARTAIADMRRGSTARVSTPREQGGVIRDDVRVRVR